MRLEARTVHVFCRAGRHSLEPGKIRLHDTKNFGNRCSCVVVPKALFHTRKVSVSRVVRICGRVWVIPPASAFSHGGGPSDRENAPRMPGQQEEKGKIRL